MVKEGIGKAMLGTVREWMAGLGAVGNLFVAIILPAMGRLSSAPAIIGFCLSVLGIAAGVVGIRSSRLLGWLLAAASLGLAIATVALARTAPG